MVESPEYSRHETEPPTTEELQEFMEEGYCPATDGCIVEPDGTCEHGCPSWMLELGIV